MTVNLADAAALANVCSAFARTAAQAVLKPQFPDHPERFGDNVAGHF
jgi:hypothetical protein